MPLKPTPEFEQWFGNSKVVDADGKPLVVYHGTDAHFREFRSDPRGIWFSQDISDSEDYGSRLICAYLSLQNPAKFERYRDDAGINQAVASAKQDGCDGLIVTSPEDGDESGMYWPTNYVAFSPSQIKGATGNNGNFDAANPDIRFSMPELLNQTGVLTPARTPNRPDCHLGKKIMTSATSDINVAMSFRQVSPVGGGNAQYVFDIYRLDPPLKKPEDMKRTVVGSVIYYAGLKEPVLTQYYPSVHQLDRDRIISVARPGSSGGVCGDALKWSPVDGASQGSTLIKPEPEAGSDTSEDDVVDCSDSNSGYAP